MVVRYLFYCLLFWACPLLAEVSVSLKLDSPLVSEKPIQVFLTISSALTESVDQDSFSLEGSPLEVRLIEERSISPKRQERVYSFSLPGKSAGLYVLQAIQFTVNGRKFETDKVAYEITSSLQSSSLQQQAGNVILLLEAFLDQEGSLYPGQIVESGYRYIYNDTIELTKETLPLLQPQGFTVLGNPKARSFLRGSVMVREVRQQLRAEVPGQYTIGPSVVEGYVYRSSFGQKKHIGEKLIASAPPVSVEIHSFPKEGRPASFYGAIGTDLSIKAEVRGFTDISLGEAINLTVLIAGTGDVQNAPAPKLCCQPEFVGRLEEADIPVVETFKDGKKYVVVDLKPLSTSVKEIPSIEYSFFNPLTNSYKTIKTDPIPITVVAKNGVNELAPSKNNQETIDGFWQPKAPIASDVKEQKALEKEGSSLFKLTFMLLAAGIMALAAYLFLFRKREKREQKSLLPSCEKSSVLLDLALQSSSESACISLLQEAFLAKLQEIGEIPFSDIPFEEMADTGNSLRVKEFFTTLEKERFSGKQALQIEKVKKDALSLFHSLP